MPLNQKLLTAAAGLILVAAGVTASLGFLDDEPEEQPSTLPQMHPGTTAEYEASGGAMGLVNLLGPHAFHTPPADLSPGTQLTVTLTQTQLPDTAGEIVPSQTLAVATPNQTLTATTRTGEHPFLFTQPTIPPWWPAGLGPTEPVTEIRAQPASAEATTTTRVDAGFADAFLLEGETIPAEPTPITTLGPPGPALAEQATPQTPWRIHTEPTPNDAPEDATYIVVERGATTHATYTYTPDCPLPYSVTYPQTSEPFHATRTACTPGQPATTDADTDPARAWPAPENQPYERAFPGQGDDFPLPYRGALDFFLQNPDTLTWTQQHPNWRLTHALLANAPEDTTRPSGWSWGFVLCENGETTTGWVTQATTSPTATWTRDPEPPTSLAPLCHAAGNQTQTPDHVTVDDLYTVYDAIVDQGAMEQDAELTAAILTPEGATFHVSRCAIQDQPSGSCYDYPLRVEINADGALTMARLEPDWYTDPFKPLITLAP